MRKAVVGVLACALAIAFVACAWVGVNPRHGSSWESSTIVRVEGQAGMAVGNMSLGYARWITSPAEGNAGALLVRDGDLLWVQMKPQEKGADKKEEFTLPWRHEDGSNLALKTDGPRLLAADKTVSLNIGSEDGSWDWLANASKQELAALRFVRVDGAIPDDRYGLFEKLARVNPHVGLALPDSALLVWVPALDPRCLFLETDNLAQADLDALVNRKEIETLILSAKDADVKLQVLAALPNLRRLTLAECYPSKTAMPDLPHLEALTFFLGGLEDLTPLKSLTGLRELNFTLTATNDLKGIEALPQLQELGICGADNGDKKDNKKPLDCAPIDALKELRWVAFGQGIAQEQFAQVVQSHPDLQVVEVINGDKDGIENLAPLATLRDLKALVFVQKDNEGPVAIEPLKQMKQLRLLVLPENMFKDKAADVAALRGELPDCVIAEGEPLCLGAGRILLLVPLTALGWLVIARRRSRAA